APFGRHVLGAPSDDVRIEKAQDLGIELPEDPENYRSVMTALGDLYRQGVIVLDCVGVMAHWITENSAACRRYLKARYAGVFIDEYQDCGHWQQELFLKMVALGITGVAVGDIDQSIYAFAHKYPRYLASLLDDDRFRVFAISRNRRCHVSIHAYAMRMRSAQYEPPEVEERRVFARKAKGDEVQLGVRLSGVIPCLMQRFGVQERREVAILVQGGRTGAKVAEGLTIPFRLHEGTPLDDDSSLWGTLFRSVLFWVFSQERTKTELVEDYLNIEYRSADARRALAILRAIQQAATIPNGIAGELDRFVALAKLLRPEGERAAAINRLRAVLGNPKSVEAFSAAQPNEVQIMTLHKAKGLEFDLVVHLDLYKWILPRYKGDETQDLNLHYVGITRAKKVCLLYCSTLRTKANGQVVDAEPSPFLFRNGVQVLRGSLA
ncbi:MAG: 3'-5' exonuclease, partial [Deltaproteobacteria bacterium]